MILGIKLIPSIKTSSMRIWKLKKYIEIANKINFIILSLSISLHKKHFDLSLSLCMDYTYMFRPSNQLLPVANNTINYNCPSLLEYSGFHLFVLIKPGPRSADILGVQLTRIVSFSPLTFIYLHHRLRPIDTHLALYTMLYNSSTKK